MRWFLIAALLVLPVSAFAQESQKRVEGLLPIEREEMQLCVSLNDYRTAVEEVDKLSAQSTPRDVEYAFNSVEEEWQDVEQDADDYEAVQTTQLARSATQLDQAMKEVGENGEPQVIQSHAGPKAQETLQQLDEVQAQVECSKSVPNP